MKINKLIYKAGTMIIVISTFFIMCSIGWTATYYVDATNGNDNNSGLSPSSAWKTIAKVNSSNFNPGAQILFKGRRFGGGNLSFLLQDKKPNRLSVSLIHFSRPDTFSNEKKYILDKLFRWISSQLQGAGSKLQVTTFMERKCEPVPNFQFLC